MLNINPDIVCSIISHAREFHAQEQVVIPDKPDTETSDEDWAYQVLAEHDSDLTFQELKNEIEGLEPDQKDILVALMWLGRGDFDKSEWKEALKLARSRRSAHTAEYLIGTPLVADYLEEGLSNFGHSCEI